MALAQQEVRNHDDVLDWLERYGYHTQVNGEKEFKNLGPTDPEFQKLVLMAQSFGHDPTAVGKRGFVKVDGVAGPKTMEFMSRERCGCPDFGPGSGREVAKPQARWPDACNLKIKTYCNFQGLQSSGISVPQLEELWYKGFLETERVCNIKTEKTTRKELADCFAYAGVTEPGVLAWAEFPINCSVQSESRFGTRWNWTKEMMEDTALHEQGHQWGLPHLPIGNVMYFQMDRKHNQTWKPGDIKELVALYGLPKQHPSPPPKPGGPDMNWGEIFKLLLPIILEIIKSILNLPKEEQQKVIQQIDQIKNDLKA